MHPTGCKFTTLYHSIQGLFPSSESIVYTFVSWYSVRSCQYLLENGITFDRFFPLGIVYQFIRCLAVAFEYKKKVKKKLLARDFNASQQDWLSPVYSGRLVHLMKFILHTPAH